ncbi:MAG: YdiU family protein [Pseudomonadota bacterium]
MTVDAPFAFDNSYARLPERFFVRLDPTRVAAPEMVRLNAALAEELGLDPAFLAGPEGVEILAGNRLPTGAEPLAMAYAGHQFGNWVPQLGDGRAILLGEIVDRAGRRRDLQLKGSGPTPFSRMGDGRAGLGPVLREYIISEAMAALGVPTTRSLAAVKTGEAVIREVPQPGAVLTRVAASHIRVGTFQFFAAREDHAALQVLTDHVIARHYPDLADSDRPALALIERLVDVQARLVAQWMGIGFIHGVMNTDNMSIAGETIDYGPCAFLDAYHPATVFSSIDQYGRYAFANQSRVAHWNLAQFAAALLPLIDEDRAKATEATQAAIDGFTARFTAAYLAVMRRKLGLATAADGDEALAAGLLKAMAEGLADFTRTFRALAHLPNAPGEADQQILAETEDPAALAAWLKLWRARLAEEEQTEETRQQRQRAANPAVIPRNHLVEEALAAATVGDLAPFEALLAVLADPYADPPADSRYTRKPVPSEVVHQTFCGT